MIKKTLIIIAVLLAIIYCTSMHISQEFMKFIKEKCDIEIWQKKVVSPCCEKGK